MTMFNTENYEYEPNTEKPYVIRLIFSPEYRDWPEYQEIATLKEEGVQGLVDAVQEYRFATAEEANAFMEGVEAANGWMEYSQVDAEAHEEICRLRNLAAKVGLTSAWAQVFGSNEGEDDEEDE